MSRRGPSDAAMKMASRTAGQIIALLLNKLRLPELIITLSDLEALDEQYPDTAILIRDEADGVHIMCITGDQAEALLEENE